MSDYNPTNPAFDIILSVDRLISNMKPKKLEADSTRGLMRNRTQTVDEARQDGRMQIAKYVKTLRDIRESK